VNAWAPVPTKGRDEMLRELRVSQTKVQILTEFLLTLPFQQRFPGLDTVQRNAYLGVLLGAVLRSAFSSHR